MTKARTDVTDKREVADCATFPVVPKPTRRGANYEEMCAQRRAFLAAFRRWLVQDVPSQADAEAEAVGMVNSLRQFAALSLGEGSGRGR